MAATSASLGMMTAKITRSGISLQSRSFNGLTFIPEHWVCMRSNLCQCFEHSHDHLVVISELLFTHKYFKLLMNTNQDLMDGWARAVKQWFLHYLIQWNLQITDTAFCPLWRGWKLFCIECIYKGTEARPVFYQRFPLYVKL